MASGTGPLSGLRSKIVAAFAPPPDPKEAVQTWTRQIRSEMRALERSVMAIERGKKKAEQQVKLHAKQGNLQSAKVIAREIVNTNKAISRIHTQRAHMMDMEMALKHQLAMVKVAGTLSKSTEVMKAVNDLVQSGNIPATMREMSKEMMKAGLIEEMIDEVMEPAQEEDEAADEEVEQVLQEVAGEQLAALPTPSKAAVEAEPEVVLPDDPEKEQAILEALAAGKVPEHAT